MSSELYKLLFLSCLAFSLVSCKVTKLLKENETLLKKNVINTHTDDDVLNKWFIKEELQTIPVQKTNKKFLYVIPFKLLIYTAASGKKETKISWWIKNNVGEAPVIYDSSKVETSKNLLLNYYQNKGYFFTEVNTTVKTSKRRRTTVTYNIDPKEAFKFRNVYFPSTTPIEQIVANRVPNTLLKRGLNFDVVTLKNERQRIADDINNEGYFYFTKDYVFFELDTFHASKEIDVRIRVANYRDSTDFDKYQIDSVFVFFENDQDIVKGSKIRDSIKINEYTYYFNKLLFRPQAISNSIYLFKDSLYNKNNYQSSVQKISELGAFRFINISFDDKYPNDSLYRLNAYVTLSPYKRQFMSYGLELYNNFEGLFGSGVSVSYNNRNLSKNADKLSITATLGTEFNFRATNSLTNNSRTDFLLSSEYYINKLLLPFKIKDLDKNTHAISKLAISYNYENRSGFYKLHNTNFSFGYQWSNTTRLKHAYYPVSINLIYMPENAISDKFLERLQNNPILKNSFSENLILGSNYSLIYSSGRTKTSKHHYNLTFNAETAGNFFELAALVAGRNEDNKSILGRNYSQFVKLMFEFRDHLQIHEKSSFNTKLKLGYGAAYGNSVYLPYIKQFFSGGPNSIRGWTVRTLGPGGYKYADTVKVIDELGDMQLEISAEYRFNIFKWFNGVVFLDAGNVWLRQPDALKPNAEFKLSRFFQDIAIAGGVGLRLDFDYFVIRWDVGFPIKVPYDLEGGQWVIKDAAIGNYNWRQQNLVHNLAVGYPF